MLTKEQATELLMSTMPGDIQSIVKALNTAGYDVFLVGGSVRDSFFGQTPKDFDLCTNALPDQVMEVLSNVNIPCEPRGVEFGVIVAKGSHGAEYEIATFRADVYRNHNIESFIQYIRETKPLNYEERINLLLKTSNSKNI
mgnify:CR=1 FL=1